MGYSPARSAVDVGSIIADTYTIEALIGRGGMGAVFLASHNRLPGKKVAIKLLHAELTDEEVVARFRREALIASQLDHPNIVGVTDFNVTPDGTPYLVLEFLHGETLAQRLSLGPLPLDEAMSILRQVGSAVAAAHRAGIVHRDLKPQNIFLVPTELHGHSVEIAKVLDFGISKIRGSQTVKTQESTLLGTPQYMAPEQATGQHALVDERTDVFALGAIAYEMLAGEPAFSGANIPEVVFKVVYEPAAPLGDRAPGLAPHVIAAIEQAMAKQRDDRFASVGAFIEALTGQPLAATLRPSPSPIPVTGRGGRPKPLTTKDTGKDAFAQTMGSVDQTSPPLPAPPPPVAPAPAPAAGTTPPARRSTGRIVGLALGCAAIAAVAMYFAMRPDKPAPSAPEPAPEPVEVATAPADAALAPDALAALDAAVVVAVAPDAAAVERARPPNAASTGHSGPRGSGGPAKPEPTDPPEPTEPEDPTLRDQLRAAEAALAGGQLGRAEQLANAVIDSSAAGPRQRARAHLIRGTVQCTMNHNQEGALISLRNIAQPRLRRQLIDACQRAGIQLMPR
ncbi:MAG: serine/threonine-protein kinase [Kofleriaceae bacterium]